MSDYLLGAFFGLIIVVALWNNTMQLDQKQQARYCQGLVLKMLEAHEHTDSDSLEEAAAYVEKLEQMQSDYREQCEQ